MKGINEFKERILNDPEFAKKLRNVKSRNDIIKIAKANNYIFSSDELKNEEISEDVLDAVAGGSKKGSQEINETVIYGDNYHEFVGTPEEGEIIAELLRENKK